MAVAMYEAVETAAVSQAGTSDESEAHEPQVEPSNPSASWLRWQLGLVRRNPVYRNPDTLRTMSKAAIYCGTRARRGQLTAAGLSNEVASRQFDRDAIGFQDLADLLEAYPEMSQPESVTPPEAALVLSSIATRMQAVYAA